MLINPIDEVTEFIQNITDENIKKTAEELLILIQKHTSLTPKLTMKTIIGFGDYHYKYESGREGDTFLIGFSPRKKNVTMYFTYGFGNLKEEMALLGKYTTGKSCLHINKMADINIDILSKMIEKGVKTDQTISYI